MNALSSLRSGNAAETDAVTSLLRGTQEVERRIQQPIHRWWWLWRRDVREGWVLLGRFQVRKWSILDMESGIAAGH